VTAKRPLRRVEWSRWAQVIGFLLGLWQIVEWKILGAREPNVGVMGFAGSLMLLQRAVSARQQHQDDDDD
jgi:hypothetical protein